MQKYLNSWFQHILKNTQIWHLLHYVKSQESADLINTMAESEISQSWSLLVMTEWQTTFAM